MTTIADIFCQAGPAYRAQFADRLLPSHRAAMRAIERCRTAALGGHVARCPRCATTRYCYHSCRNRHCPTCQQEVTQSWLTKQQALLLPVPYFLVTFTVPATLRTVIRQHQRQLYALLFRASAAALQHLAADPRFLGGQIGMLGVLQTWTRDLRYHPHIHYLVPAVALQPDGQAVVHPTAAFLVPVKPLAILFRATFRAALAQLHLAAAVPAETWTQPWVVDCRPVGDGHAALKYLAPYVARGPLSNNRIVRATEQAVTFRYRDGATRRHRTCTVTTSEFVRRFLQHVLPKGFVKVRHFGLFSPRQRQRLSQIRALLLLAHGAEDTVRPVVPPVTPVGWQPPRCPRCGQPMVLQPLPPHSRGPPPAGPGPLDRTWDAAAVACRLVMSGSASWPLIPARLCGSGCGHVGKRPTQRTKAGAPKPPAPAGSRTIPTTPHRGSHLNSKYLAYRLRSTRIMWRLHAT